MDQKTLSEIDYYRIRDFVASFCVSEEGKAEILGREPLTDFKKIEFLKNLGSEWKTFYYEIHNNPVKPWNNISSLFAIIKTNGASLNLAQVQALANFCLSLKSIRESIKNHAEKLNLKNLLEQVNLLPDESEAERLIFHVITKDGEMRDLPEIVAIRKSIASLNAKLKNIMQSYISDQKYQAVLESFVPVLRGGRQVLAVKASLQNRIQGIVHEVSQTAQTVYIEPGEAVECSNELVQKENELVQIINKILADLTLALQPCIPFFKNALPLMIMFDTTFAAAKWGIENNCIYAQSCKNEPPVLLKARHPLLKDRAVPIDIRFMENKRLLIITGPNTGGKTVSLKTFALFSMLNQAGFPIPCAEGTKLPVFNKIFADIGDEQSLDQSLSTFSGHMKNIARAVSESDEKTLILLDELGSGTDPMEGTAISMAVLDELIEKKSFVLVTTHQGILKNYGYTNASCINASVEFDKNTLSPSYRLIMGIPGESHALDIARKNGFPEKLIKAARNYISTEQADVSALIRGLNRKHIELNEVMAKNKNLEENLLEKESRLKQRDLDLRKKENQLKKGHQQEMYDFLVHSRRQLENLVRTLREGEITKEKTKNVKSFISELEQNVNRFDSKIEAEEEKLLKEQEQLDKVKKYPSSAKKTKKRLSNAEALQYASPVMLPVKKEKAEELAFKEGTIVRSKTTMNEGELISLEKKGVWLVQFGSIRMSIKEKDLVLLKNKDDDGNKIPEIKIDYSVDSAKERPVFELRLLGMRAEEALKVLQHQIDLCAINNFMNFSIIHGKGDGILQQLVKDYLSHCPLVKDFSFASAEDGGAGKTYVELNG
ncbi:MAG: Smr/MutS family protein [Treponema sp.]|nr:Smr/MutS family protein [Treponema sp.]